MFLKKMNNIVDTIVDETKGYLKKIAVIDGESKVSYAELLEAVKDSSEELKKRGVLKFQRVALLSEDGIDYIVASLAVLKLHSVIVPIPIGSSLEEIESVLSNLKVNFIIFEKDCYTKKGALRIFKKSAFKKEFSIFQLNPKKGLPQDFFKINPAFIRFSSGTTGESKGVVLSHETIIARTSAANKGLKVTSKDQIIWVLSMSFHFVVTILLFLRRAATIIISSRQFPYELLDNLRKYKPTFIYASPVHYHILSSLNLPKKSFSRLRLVVSTAVKLAPNIADRFYREFNLELAEAYGIIEVGLPFINLSKRKSKRGSVGKIISDYNLKIADKDKEGIGKIYIKGKGIFDAYFSPWRNRKDILTKGWFNTGDLGKLDKDGFLYIVGREKNMINFSGMKVFPFEVESILNQHPLVQESYVYGVAHPEYGQVPLAKVILRAGEKRARSLKVLRRFCYKTLASYKVPKEFEFVDKLPKTASGKTKYF
jgi:long-chain acyl-CoA synthetase